MTAAQRSLLRVLAELGVPGLQVRHLPTDLVDVASVLRLGALISAMPPDQYPGVDFYWSVLRPAPRVLALIARFGPQRLAKLLAARLDDGLGDDRPSWETFCALVDTWSGTLAELAEASQAVLNMR